MIFLMTVSRKADDITKEKIAVVKKTFHMIFRANPVSGKA